MNKSSQLYSLCGLQLPACHLVLVSNDIYLANNQQPADETCQPPYPFVVENNADEICIKIKDNVIVELPIILLYIFAVDATKHSSTPTTKITVGSNSAVTLQELYINNNQQCQLQVAAQTSIQLASNAQCNHTILQQSAGNDQQTLTVNALQQQGSILHSHVFGAGGASNSVTIRVTLAGSKARCNLQSLLYTTDANSHNIDILMDHQHGDSTSSTVVKSVLQHNSRAAMHGKILVAKQANQVNAALKHKTMLLSPLAKVVSQPQLEIYNDDVICSHSSTIGQLDPNALLYMNTRGIATIDAEQLLVQSFVASIISSMPNMQMQQHVNSLLFPRELLCTT